MSGAQGMFWLGSGVTPGIAKVVLGIESEIQLNGFVHGKYLPPNTISLAQCANKHCFQDLVYMPHLILTKLTPDKISEPIFMLVFSFKFAQWVMGGSKLKILKNSETLHIKYLRIAVNRLKACVVYLLISFIDSECVVLSPLSHL